MYDGRHTHRKVILLLYTEGFLISLKKYHSAQDDIELESYKSARINVTHVNHHNVSSIFTGEQPVSFIFKRRKKNYYRGSWKSQSYTLPECRYTGM